MMVYYLITAHLGREEDQDEEENKKITHEVQKSIVLYLKKH